MNFKQAKAIYSRICKANGFWVRPILLYDKYPARNASSYGWGITVYKGALDAYNDDEMAHVIAHELAHFRLGHFLKRNTPQRELDADRVGWMYAKKAGYNMCKAKQRFKKWRQRATKTHPSTADRYAALPKCPGDK